MNDLAAARELFLAPEPEEDPVPARFFSIDALQRALDLSTPACAHSMGKLVLRQQFIDLDAVHRLLTARYGWASDDVAHDDPFQQPVNNRS